MSSLRICEPRLVAFVLGVYNLYHCFDNDWEDELKNNTDERDLFIAMKSGQKTVQLMNSKDFTLHSNMVLL